MKTHALITTAILLWALSTSAAPDIYFAEDRSPYVPTSQGGPGDVPVPSYPNSRAKAAEFLRRLPGVLTASFEGLPAGRYPMTLWFGTNSATLTGASYVRAMTNATLAVSGGFATSGTNYVLLSPTAGGIFNVEFNNPQKAFGFYGMDIEAGTFALDLYHTNGNITSITNPVAVPQGSGGVFYLGIIDNDHPFASVGFRIVDPKTDGFFFDDLTIADNPVPPSLDIRVSHVELCWDTLQDKTYQLEYRSPLTLDLWTPLGAPIPGTGHRFCTNDAVLVDSPQRYYRLTITEP